MNILKKNINKVVLFILLFGVILLVGCSNDKINDNMQQDQNDFLVTLNFHNGSESETYVVQKGELFAYLYTPTKEGYYFLGWYNESELFDPSQVIEDNITLDAKWEDLNNMIEVTYILFDSSSIKKYYFEGDKLSNMVLEEDGYQFLGWSIGESEELVDLSSLTITKSIQLISKWEKKKDYVSLFKEKMESYFSRIDRSFDITSFTLPHSEEGLTSIYWKSSHKEIVQNDGVLSRPYVDTIVSLTAMVTLEDKTVETIEFNVTIPGYKLEHATSIASTYIYRHYEALTDELFETMDILYCAFGTINKDGSVTGNKYFDNVKNYVIPKAKEKGVYVILVLGPSSEWTTVMNPDNNMVSTVTQNVMTKVKEIGFDGVDIDWEHPKTGEETWFTNFAKSLRIALNNTNSSMLLSAAISGGSWLIPHYDLKNSYSYLDQINLMTYGMEQNSKHYHNALYSSTNTIKSASIDESIKIFNSYGVENKKILVGLAFYGIKQEYVNSAWVKSSSVFYDSLLENYFNNENYVIYYDSIAQVPYIMNKDKTIFISYDNEESILKKCEYVVQNNIAGVMAWENGCDTSGTLVRAIKKGLNK